MLVATGCGGWHEESVSAYRRALGLALSHAGAVQLWARLSASGRQSRRPRGPTDRSADWPATSDCRPLEEQVYCILQITSDFVPCGGRGTFALHNFSLLKIYNVELIFFFLGGKLNKMNFWTLIMSSVANLELFVATLSKIFGCLSQHCHFFLFILVLHAGHRWR